jgi:hypothetical protein
MLILSFAESFSTRCISTLNAVSRDGDIFNGKCVLFKHMFN